MNGCATSRAPNANDPPENRSRYLYVWAGDSDGADSDFLAVIDVQPSSATYARVVATLPVDVANPETPRLAGSFAEAGEYDHPDSFERAGGDLNRESWPHGDTGSAAPHGTVFSRG